MLRILLILTMTAAFAAGCTQGIVDGGATESGEAARDGGTLSASVHLAETQYGPRNFAFDVLCVAGGGPEIPRSDGRVLATHEAIVVQITAADTWTGWQVGYSLDDAPVTWLPIVRGEGVQKIAITPEMNESTGARWVFHYQNNVEGAEQDCYTGGGVGEAHILVTAEAG